MQSSEPTIQIVDVFSVLIKNEPDYNYERLSEKPDFCECDDDMLVAICLKMESYKSNSEAISDPIAHENIVNTVSVEPSSSSDLPDNESSDRVMSQALDLRLRIDTIDNDLEQQVPQCDADSNTEVQYKFITVKEHVRKIKVGAKRRSVTNS